jgi:hypothetical protein
VLISDKLGLWLPNSECDENCRGFGASGVSSSHRTVAYLAGEEGRWITKEKIRCDGGIRLGASRARNPFIRLSKVADSRGERRHGVPRAKSLITAFPTYFFPLRLLLANRLKGFP